MVTKAKTPLTAEEMAHLLREAGWFVMPPLDGVVLTSTMCPGCGQNRVVASDGSFLPHHTDHDGVGGPVCSQGVVEDDQPVESEPEAAAPKAPAE